MPQITDLIQSGGQNIWLALPLAVILGALHGLEPGHAKSMMAAFIVAVRGTAGQAALLALAATVSHTAVVWIIVLAGLSLGGRWDFAANEPYFELASAVIIVGVALWMLAGARAAARRRVAHHHGAAGHDHEGDHDHHLLDAETSRETYDADAMDAHEARHAREIGRRFAGRDVTTGQLIMFGLTGGLVPCAAAVTVLLLCLQLREIYLGALVVLAFSAGLALTLIASGLAAAWGVRSAQRRWSGFDALFRRAPYISGALVLSVGLAMAYSAWIDFS